MSYWDLYLFEGRRDVTSTKNSRLKIECEIIRFKKKNSLFFQCFSFYSRYYLDVFRRHQVASFWPNLYVRTGDFVVDVHDLLQILLQHHVM